MRHHYYDFFGKVLLEVRGDGGRSTEQFYTMYDQFEVENPDREPDIVVEQTTEDIGELEAVLGDPSDYYGWTGERFVIRNGSNYMAVEPGWDHIYVSPNWEPFFAIYPVEFRIRQKFVEEGRALVHASGIDRNGQTTLFPAWRGGGKTNTLVSLLREGAGFLSDDRLWVGRDRTALGYPLSVNLQPYNIQSFPEITVEHDDFQDHLRYEVSQYLDANIDSTGSILNKGINFLNHQFLKENGRSFTDVSELFPRAEYLDEATVDNVVILRAAPNADHVVVEEMSAEEAVSDVTAISYYEWDEQLEEYFRAYDALCPGPSVTDQLEAVVEAEEEIFRELLEDVDTYRASIPRAADWNARGLDREIVDAIESLPTRRQIKATN
jgi:hypothetical protein